MEKDLTVVYVNWKRRRAQSKDPNLKVTFLEKTLTRGALFSTPSSSRVVLNSIAQKVKAHWWGLKEFKSHWIITVMDAVSVFSEKQIYCKRQKNRKVIGWSQFKVRNAPSWQEKQKMLEISSWGIAAPGNKEIFLSRHLTVLLQNCVSVLVSTERPD